LKQSIRQLQQLHGKGLAHGAIEPLTIGIESPYRIEEGTLDTTYAAPEVALAIAVGENYTPEEAVRLWKRDSKSMQWMERWLPGVAEIYTAPALKRLIGTPLPEQQSDIWSLGISYLCMMDTLYTAEHPFPEKHLFFEALSAMLRLRGRSLPVLSAVVASAGAAAAPAVPAVPAVPAGIAAAAPSAPAAALRSAGLTLAEPIHRGARNKTRKNPCN